MIYFLLVILLLFSCLLYLPIQVEVDTEQQVYRAGWRGIISVWGIPEEKRWRWFYRVFFWEREWIAAANQPGKETAPQKTKKPAAKKKRNFSWSQGKLLMCEIFRAIRLERLRIDWDTGDFILNAWLYPVFRVASGGQRYLNINFKGEQILAFRLFTRPGLLMMAGLRLFFTIKK